MIRYNNIKVPNDFLEDIANYMNRVYGHRCKDNFFASCLGLFKAYDREVRVFWYTNRSPEQAGDFLSQFLKLGPERTTNYLTIVQNNMSGWETIMGLKREGHRIRLRGRGANRKAKVNAVGRTLNHCHDLPVSLSDTIAIYRR